MNKEDYFPYLCQADAMEEYKSLRCEILESQKQRISLLNYSLVIIGVLFGYLVSDKQLSSTDCLFLVVLTIAPALFSYATRCRERRIASYLGVFLGRVSPWSGLSSNNSELSLGFFQRSSTTIIVFVILLDIAFLGSSWPFPSIFASSIDLKYLSQHQVLWFVALIVSALNVFIAFFTSKLPKYRIDFKAALKSLKDQSTNTEPLTPADTGKPCR
jgi:hypothetical protein